MVGISPAGTKRILKMIYKYGTVEMVIFLAMIITLLREAPELLIMDWSNIQSLNLVVFISIWSLFGRIMLVMIMEGHRTVILMKGETQDRLEKKLWLVKSTIEAQATAIAEETSTKIVETVEDAIKKELTPEEKAAEINIRIKELEAEIIELNNIVEVPE